YPPGHSEEDARDLGPDGKGGCGEESVLQEGLRFAAQLRITRRARAPRHLPTVRAQRRPLLAAETVTGTRTLSNQSAFIHHIRTPLDHQPLVTAIGLNIHSPESRTNVA